MSQIRLLLATIIGVNELYLTSVNTIGITP